MKKNGVIAIIIIALVLIIAIFVFDFAGTGVSDNSKESQRENPTSLMPVPGSGDVEETELSIEITSSGFSPKTLEINSGDTVTWTNKDSRSHWLASAVHPTHTIYPGSSINKCGTSEALSIFDSCKGLSSGESYSFTFNEKGTWGYHDHLGPSLTGTIVVN